MDKYVSKYFGEIDLNPVEEKDEEEVDFYESKFEYKDTVITLNLLIQDYKQVQQSDIAIIDNYLSNLSEHESTIQAALKQDLRAEGVTNSYIERQIRQLDGEEINNLIFNTDKKLTEKEQLLSIISLHSINFYPEKEDDDFAIFDYTLGTELTDYLLVVVISKDLQIQYAIAILRDLYQGKYHLNFSYL
jgi:hypothetical protein